MASKTLCEMYSIKKILFMNKCLTKEVPKQENQQKKIPIKSIICLSPDLSVCRLQATFKIVLDHIYILVKVTQEIYLW